MAMHRRYSMEEFARRGDELYDRVVRPTLSAEDDGKFVALDIETGEFEVSDDEMTTGDRLYARLPSAQPWMVRVGRRWVHRFGAHRR